MLPQRDHPLSVSTDWGESQRQTFFTIFPRSHIQGIRLFYTQECDLIPWGHLQIVTILWRDYNGGILGIVPGCGWWYR